MRARTASIPSAAGTQRPVASAAQDSTAPAARMAGTISSPAVRAASSACGGDRRRVATAATATVSSTNVTGSRVWLSTRSAAVAVARPGSCAATPAPKWHQRQHQGADGPADEAQAHGPPVGAAGGQDREQRRDKRQGEQVRPLVGDGADVEAEQVEQGQRGEGVRVALARGDETPHAELAVGGPGIQHE